MQKKPKKADRDGTPAESAEGSPSPLPSGEPPFDFSTIIANNTPSVLFAPSNVEITNATNLPCRVVGATAETNDLQWTLPHKDSLTTQYQNLCSGCHGSAGEGSAHSPALRSVASEAAFFRIIRNGSANMPPFDSSLISDDSLKSDFLKLSGKSVLPSVNPENLDLRPVRAFQEAEYYAVMQKGLFSWRTPGERGACMSCHGPDGIDLARFNYPASAILRRAVGQGLTPKQGLDIAQMIDAQRWRYKIDAPCDPATPPMQPGLTIAATQSGWAADRALMEKLGKVGVTIFQEPTQSTASLPSYTEQAAIIQRLDVSKIELAVSLNRWSQDIFHGEKQRSTAEWLPEIPMEPKENIGMGAWLATQNTYLADPSDKNFWNLYDAVTTLDGHRFTPGGVSERIAREKYRSVLIHQHQLRHLTRNYPDLGAATDINRITERFSIWETGQIANAMARGCAEAGDANDPFPCWHYPNSFYKKMGADRRELLTDVMALNAPWLIAGWIVDPSLQFTEAGGAQIIHLIEAVEKNVSARNIGSIEYNQLPIHAVYFAVTRLVKSVTASDNRFAEIDPAYKASSGCWLAASEAIEQWAPQVLPHLNHLLGGSSTSTIITPEISPAHKFATYRSVAGAHRLILNGIKSSLASTTLDCKVDPQAAKRINSLLDGILQWHETIDRADTDITTLALDLQTKFK